MIMNNMTNATPKTEGQIEAEISEAIIKFEKEYIGRGPDETKTYIINDMIVIRLQRVLTPAEQQLVQSDGDAKGRTLIKQVRTELLEKARPLLEAMVRGIVVRVLCSGWRGGEEEGDPLRQAKETATPRWWRR